MGLTIHYSLKSTTKLLSKAQNLVAQMRQFALDLPFESVGEIIDLSGDEANFELSEDEELRWFLIQAHKSIEVNKKRISRTQTNSQIINCPPTRVLGFSINPGDGCEQLNLGLCSYPAEVWHHGTPYKTKLNGWRWLSFCKTQYASDPSCGGLPNFVRCHVAAITLLNKIGTLPTIKLEIDDEGHYGPAKYSDDYRDAYAEKRKPTYVWHPATFSVQTLIKECGESNERIAAFFGALQDAGGKWESPITEFCNFEKLEFKGQDYSEVRKFLNAMKARADTSQQVSNPVGGIEN